jgi:ureidoacrylate peracid hydrolase
MHTLSIPQSVVDRVIERRGREHIYDNLDPAKTALVVVDMQNAFMLPGVAHALCPMAEKIVPNINRLARAVRETGGTVVWIKTTFEDLGWTAGGRNWDFCSCKRLLPCELGLQPL